MPSAAVSETLVSHVRMGSSACGGTTTELMVRTLPIRVAPLDGESLESWLAAIALRLNVTWAELLHAVLPSRAQGGPRPWFSEAVLDPDEVAAIATATGVRHDAVRDLTLAGARASWLEVDDVARRVYTPWGQAARQRFCPQCIAQTNGRWSLEWRLPWITICVKHRCLLLNNCPECGRGFRATPGWVHSPRCPQPMRCWCGCDLAAAATDVLPEDHAAIVAQETLCDLLAKDTVDKGIYCTGPVAGAQLLTDARRLALRIFGTTTPRRLVRGFGQLKSKGEIGFWSDRVWQHTDGSGARPIQFAAGAPAPVICAGTTAALHILLQTNLERAATALTRIAPPSRGHRIRPNLTFRGHGASMALCAVEILTRAPGWDPILKLRFRAYAPMPRYPSSYLPVRQDPALRATPTLMWPDWAMVLTPSVVGRLAWPTQRQLLSWLLLEVGTRRTESSIHAALRVKIERKRVHDIAVAMSRRRTWPQFAAALTQLDAYLAAQPPPIDYQRRRELNYRELLSSEQWQELCERAAVRIRTPWLADTAREWLSERLSAAPASARGETAEGKFIDYFLLTMTPELKTELDSHAADFLRQRDIDEPAVWSPPLAILSDRELAGVMDNAIPIGDVHALLDRPHSSVHQVSRELKIPFPVLRHLLEERPLPTRTTRQPTYTERLRVACSDDELRRLYLEEGLTLKEIGHRFGISANGPYVVDRARACGIALRHEARDPIDAVWLWEHHIVQRQTLGEMAAESDDTISRIQYWSERHGIPIQKYYRRPLNEQVARHAAALGVEKLLAPVRCDQRGWSRLQRFATASAYPTFADAARAIGCRSDTLSDQTAMLEADFGTQLLERAVRQKKSMRLTALGTKIVEAVQRIERQLPG
jgi:hypothetical protein